MLYKYVCKRIIFILSWKPGALGLKNFVPSCLVQCISSHLMRSHVPCAPHVYKQLHIQFNFYPTTININPKYNIHQSHYFVHEYEMNA